MRVQVKKAGPGPLYPGIDGAISLSGNPPVRLRVSRGRSPRSSERKNAINLVLKIVLNQRIKPYNHNLSMDIGIRKTWPEKRRHAYSSEFL
jgi:hypothetical protein